MSSTYEAGEELEIEIAKIVPGGLGIGFAEGLTVFTALAAPGDRLRVRLTEVKKRTGWAEIVDVLHGGPSRISPPCGYFGICGGCDLQQLDYPAQLAAKVEIIRDCLHRIAKIDTYPEIKIIPSPAQLEYRSRVRWHIDRTSRAIGYYRRDSHEVVDIQRCPKITPALNRVLSELRDEVEWDSFFADRFDVEAAEGGGAEVSVYSDEFVEPPANVTTEILGESFTYNARTFFQANRSIVPDLISTATGDYSGEIALELYSGVGLFSVPLAKRFSRVFSVEEFGPASENAKFNAAANGSTNIEIVNRNVERFLRDSSDLKPDLILLDPPRSGTEKGTIPLIAGIRPPNISYVSCDPSILARDLRVLVDAGYKIQSITALDLFPQTHHVETVLHLS